MTDRDLIKKGNTGFRPVKKNRHSAQIGKTGIQHKEETQTSCSDRHLKN